MKVNYLQAIKVTLLIVVLVEEIKKVKKQEVKIRKVSSSIFTTPHVTKNVIQELIGGKLN